MFSDVFKIHETDADSFDDDVEVVEGPGSFSSAFSSGRTNGYHRYYNFDSCYKIFILIGLTTLIFLIGVAIGIIIMKMYFCSVARK